MCVTVVTGNSHQRSAVFGGRLTVKSSRMVCSVFMSFGVAYS